MVTFPSWKPTFWIESPICAASPGTVVPFRIDTVTLDGLIAAGCFCWPLPEDGPAKRSVGDFVGPSFRPSCVTPYAAAPPTIRTPAIVIVK